MTDEKTSRAWWLLIAVPLLLLVLQATTNIQSASEDEPTGIREYGALPTSERGGSFHAVPITEEEDGKVTERVSRADSSRVKKSPRHRPGDDYRIYGRPAQEFDAGLLLEVGFDRDEIEGIRIRFLELVKAMRADQPVGSNLMSFFSTADARAQQRIQRRAYLSERTMTPRFMRRNN